MKTPPTLNLFRYVFDTETHKIRRGLAAPPGVCLTDQIVEVDASDRSTIKHEPRIFLFDDGLDELEYRLASDDFLFIGQNIAYDFAAAAAKRPLLLERIFEAYESNRVSDVKIREKLQALAVGELADEGETGAKRAQKFSLDAIIMRRFGHVMTQAEIDKMVNNKKGQDSWRLRYSELDGVPLEQWPEEAVEYAIGDPVDTYKVWEDQEKTQLVRTGSPYIPDEFAQARAAWWLNLARVWGIRTNGDSVAKLENQLRKRLYELDSKLKLAGILKGKYQKGTVKWTRDMKRLRSIVQEVYEAGGREVPLTDAGQVSTEKDKLLEAPATHTASCVEGVCSDDCTYGILHAVAERNGVEKILSTNIPEFKLGAQFPINPNWNELVATGRTSVGFWQNPPRKGAVRECVEPRPGYLLVSSDYAFIELCTLAQVCLDKFGHSKLAEAINNDLDPHLDMAAELLGISYEEALSRKKEKQVKDMRQLSKSLNFGFPGGLGAETFVIYAAKTYDVHVTPDDARKLKQKWLKKWPEMNRYFQWVGDRTAASGHFDAVQHRSNRVRGGAGFCDGANTFFQGKAADGAKNSGFLIAKECYLENPYGDGPTDLYGSRTILFLHDEFILEVPERTAHEAAMRLSKVMEIGMKVFVPDVKVRAEPALMRKWYKSADPVYDADKRLIPWEPS